MLDAISDEQTKTELVALHAVFEDSCDRIPDAIAASVGRDSLTYSELDARANRFARYLRRRGIARGSVVGLMLPRSTDCYVAMLGVLKAGAAYLPIDPEFPQERIAYMLRDSGAKLLLASDSSALPFVSSSIDVVHINRDHELIAAEDPQRLPVTEQSARSSDLCYILYTSGSTGRPKGVMVEHRNVYHLVSAERKVFEVQPSDRVYQGASLCFDLSVEEIWLAFAAGATLVAGTKELCRAETDPAEALAAMGVTVLSCVPTMLTMMNAEIPSLRLLILGGEASPESLVARWSREGRRIVNTYGPTEATVIATYADVGAGRPVTIGRPMPGYDVRLLDDDLRPVPHGEIGEICIGGPGVARGYVGLAKETDCKFVSLLPEASERRPDATRVYRSGDMGRLDDDGNLRFVGRSDAQVKLRGVRIELSEVEAALQQIEGVRAAACAVRLNATESEFIVGYIVPAPEYSINTRDLTARLRAVLPRWMIPSVIEIMDELPLLPSGKLDRSALPQPFLRPLSPGQEEAPHCTPTERRLFEIWSALFEPLRVSRDDHFFYDLGGHSLLAAQLVSALRKDCTKLSASLRDVYEYPTIRQLAAVLDARAKAVKPASLGGSKGERREHQRASHAVAGALQAVGLYFIFGYKALQLIAPYLVFFLLVPTHSAAIAFGCGLATAVGVSPSLLFATICLKWILLGRIRAGTHRIWSGYYVRWWFIQTLVDCLPLHALRGTPWLPIVYRLFGSRIGKDVHLGARTLGAFDLISIGDEASIESCSLRGWTLRDGALVIGPISVGARCYVGTNAILESDTVMETGARLEDMTLLLSGSRVPQGETWAGSPARRASNPMGGRTRLPRSPIQRALSAAYYACATSLFSVVEVIPLLPGIALLLYLGLTSPLAYCAMPVAGLSYVFFLSWEIAALKRILMARAKPGEYPVHGWVYMRSWTVEQLLKIALDNAGHLTATLYFIPWLRALGARVGKFVEVSTIEMSVPDLLELDDDCTLGDEVSLSASHVEEGWVRLAPIKLRHRVFVGNNAVIPPDTILGEGSLIGVLTLAPLNRTAACDRHVPWVGSPAIRLPARERGVEYGDERTFRPSRGLFYARACFELLRLALPGAFTTLVAVSTLESALNLWHRMGMATLGLLPLMFAAASAALGIVVVVVKWSVVGRYRPFTQPFWSGFLWRLEFVNALYEFFAIPLLLDALQGTPFIVWYLRLLGAKVGVSACIQTAGFLEWDLIEIGDRAILNTGSILQTHLFEDRVLKGSYVRIGSECEVGENSVVLYDSVLEEGAHLGALSLAMKGETVTAGRKWVGSPTGGSAAA